MITLTKRPSTADTAYRTWLGHTLACAGCRSGDPCPTAARLGRAWRKARR